MEDSRDYMVVRKQILLENVHQDLECGELRFDKAGQYKYLDTVL